MRFNAKKVSKGFIIAIDGPVAAGKGTIALLLAEKLNGFFFYTGAMYRTLALYCIENTIHLDNRDFVEKALKHVRIDILDNRVFLNGRDVTERIKKEDAAEGSSKVAVIPSVRKEMVRRQKEIAEQKIVENTIIIAEGRDTGTVVFKDAALKVFLTARLEIRAKRRLNQLLNKNGSAWTFAQVLQHIRERDARDSHREVDPLVSQPEKLDYFVLDNSDMTEEQTVEAVLEELKRRNLVNAS